MFLNSLKISLRVMKRDIGYTTINVVGLSAALAIAMLILMYASFELSYENYNPRADQLVRVTMDYLNGETVIDQDCETYSPLGQRILSEFTEVTDFTRALNAGDKVISLGEDHYRTSKIYAVDPSFFKMFHYQLLQGNSENIFTEPHQAVLTTSLAKRIFNRVDVVGETFKMSTVEEPFKILGVVADPPANTHLKFNLLISYATAKVAFNINDDDWNNNNTFTYLKLSDADRLLGFNINLAEFNDRLHAENKIPNEQVIAQPIKDIHLYSDKSFEAEKNGDATSVFFLIGVAILVIIVAIVNYINLATTKSLDRAKEVGIRKVVGSSLNQLRAQFFTESFLINLLAVLAAIAIVFICLGRFKQIAELPESFSFLQNPIFWLILCSVCFLSTLISGIFPAFFLSSIKPISVLKGKFSRSSVGTVLRKLLVVFQFTITIFLIVITLTASKQLQYMRNMDLGLNTKQTIVVRSSQSGDRINQNQTFKNRLLDYPQFQSVALSNNVPGQPSGDMTTSTSINLTEAIEKSTFNFYIYWIDSDFFTTMQMKLGAGNNFQANGQNENQVLVNEETIRLWGIANIQEAVGKTIDMWGEKHTIIGVVKNFHQSTAKDAYIPIIFIYNPINYRFASIRTHAGDVKKHLALVENVYQSTYPNSPFEFFFLDQEFESLYREDVKFKQVFGALTFLAILIACLGLLGLAAFTVKTRIREIGIRKVLGSSTWGIVSLLSSDFTKMVLTAILISLPVSYLVAGRWLDDFAFHIELEWWFFAGSGLLALIVAWLTVSLQTVKAAKVNPTQCLKED